MRKTMFMETTHISPQRTVAEIQEILAAHGANAVVVDFEALKPADVAFKYAVGAAQVPFRLPCRWKEEARPA